MVQNLDYFTTDVDPKELKYTPDRRLRTEAAAEQAIEIVDRLCEPNGSCREEDEEVLFAALQTCAYRAARPARGKRIAAGERQQWARRYRLLREYLVEQNLGLVYTMMRRFSFDSTDHDDLLSDAMFALARTVEQFDPWRGYRFSTYACTAILRALCNCSRRNRRHRRQFPFEYEVPFEIPEAVDTQTDLYVDRLHQVLNENLGELDDLEARVLSQRFPLDDDRRSTLDAIGQAVGLSKERVRQIQNAALRKLRVVLNADPILQ